MLVLPCYLRMLTFYSQIIAFNRIKMYFAEDLTQMLMLLTITFILSGLVTINLLLLKFSCNRTKKVTKIDKKPVVLRTRITMPIASQTLAPTGS